MKCIYCGSRINRAINTRIVKNKGIIKRRRQCLNCNKRFTTYEIVIKEKTNYV